MELKLEVVVEVARGEFVADVQSVLSVGGFALDRDENLGNEKWIILHVFVRWFT